MSATSFVIHGDLYHFYQTKHPYILKFVRMFLLPILELRNTKIYGLVEQKHLEDKEILRPEDLNFFVS